MALDSYTRAAGESTAVLCGTFPGGDCNPGEEVLTAAKGLYEERIVFFVDWQRNPVQLFRWSRCTKNKTTEPVFRQSDLQLSHTRVCQRKVNRERAENKKTVTGKSMMK